MRGGALWPSLCGRFRRRNCGRVAVVIGATFFVSAHCGQWAATAAILRGRSVSPNIIFSVCIVGNSIHVT